MAKYFHDHVWSYSMGTDSLDWYFELADAIMERMVVRKAFGLNEPKSVERDEKLTDISVSIQEIGREFTDFAGHFVRHSSSRPCGNSS